MEIPFRIIDTVGFEPSLFKELEAINAVKKWSRESAKEGKEDTQINVIWFCVEGTSSKLFPKTIKDLSRATVMWPSVPVVVVITKSYAAPEGITELIDATMPLLQAVSSRLWARAPSMLLSRCI